MHTHSDICTSLLTQEEKTGFIQKMVAAFYERDFANGRKINYWQLAACECKHAKAVNGTSNPANWHVECGNSERPGTYTDPMLCCLCKDREPV